MLVAPLVGAWIEIPFLSGLYGSGFVAPLVGAWIEIVDIAESFFLVVMSLPSWERGLKFLEYQYKLLYLRRSPRGSVD